MELYIYWFYFTTRNVNANFSKKKLNSYRWTFWIHIFSQHAMFIQARAAESYIFTQKDIYGSPCDILFKASIRAFPQTKITVFKGQILNILYSIWLNNKSTSVFLYAVCMFNTFGLHAYLKPWLSQSCEFKALLFIQHSVLGFTAPSYLSRSFSLSPPTHVQTHFYF